MELDLTACAYPSEDDQISAIQPILVTPNPLEGEIGAFAHYESMGSETIVGLT